VLETLAATDLIDGLVQLRLDVVAIEGDLRLGQVLKHAREAGLGHVLADLGDLVGMTAVRGQIISEGLDSGEEPTGLAGRRATCCRPGWARRS